MVKTLIIPGLDGSPAPHWQAWWAARDPSALLVEQDDWARPTPEAWETEVAGAVLAHPGAILVGHSLGAIVVARILARWPQLRVRAAVLVAPAEPSRSTRLRDFGQVPAVPFGVPAIVAASRNDPWMNFSQAEALAARWGAELCDLGHVGHVNVDSGFGPWPEGIALRDKLCTASSAGAAGARRAKFH